MQPGQRHEAILNALRDKDSWRVTDLAEHLGVSAVTIRRDVDLLAGRGELVRSHGAVKLPPEPAVEAEGLLLGLLVPTAEYYFGEIIRGARAEAESRGARIALTISEYDSDIDAMHAKQLRDLGVNGLLITPSVSEPAGETLESLLAGIEAPVVLVERDVGPGRADIEQVRSDHAQGGYTAAAHLAELGHRRIGLFLRESATSPRIEDGATAAAAALGLTIAATVKLNTPSFLPLASLIERIAAGEMTAVIAHSDQEAIKLVQQLRAHGLRVPEEVSVVGYDDEVTAIADLPLTAIAPPKFEVGAAAVGLLIDRLLHPERPPHRLALVPSLRIRATTGPAPA
ncbi:MAG TPA: substrate-binding domain-containing protein [Candidatus Limnocylindrales bacterium]